jgi:hypothetical protein
LDELDKIKERGTIINPNFGAVGSGYDSEENSGDYSDDVSDKTVSVKSGDMQSIAESSVYHSSDEENANHVIRVYDARYKIPRNTNLVDIEKKFAHR